jgi:hypothetical protein
MKRLLAFALVLIVGLQNVAPAFAARRVVVRRGPARRTVVVRRGWPLRRPARVVVVRPARVVVRVAPARYLAPVVFTGVVVAAASAPVHDALVWEDGETLSKGDDWTEFTLNCDARGTRLWIEVQNGRVQADWAEVVFENGDTQVVDFAERTHDPGLYSLLDFRDGRMVDHVRMVARAKSDEARVVLRMQK